MSESVSAVEAALLVSDRRVLEANADADEVEVSELVKLYLEGDFIACLNHGQARSVLSLLGLENMTSIAEFDAEIVRKALLSSPTERDQALAYLVVAACCLDLFLQENCTGPAVNVAHIEGLRNILTRFSVEDAKASLDQVRLLEGLVSDGELPYRWTSLPVLLIIAKSILETIEATCKDNTKTWAIWTARCLFLQQRLLEETSETLHDGIFSRLDAALDPDSSSSIVQSFSDRAVGARLMIERGYMHSYYHESSRARATWQRARQLAKVELELTGALGKRTKFQRQAVPQLVIKAVSTSSADLDVCPHVPQLEELQDDTLLDSITLEDGHEVPAGPLPVWDQALLLASCTEIEKHSGRHELTNEEMRPFVDRVLAHPVDWLIQSSALLTKTRLEKERTRTLQRSTVQLARLVDNYREEEPSGKWRLSSVHIAPYPLYWQLQHELAQRYLTLGLVRDALEVYQRIELWDGIITCYQMLDQDRKAEELVRQRLEVEPSPALWCTLGDITRQEEHYLKAWELSEHRLTRAQRSLGLILLRQAEHAFSTRDELDEAKYQRVIECFQQCLKLNPMQADVWFSLGCAAQRLSDFETAARAFRRKVELDDDDFESWNNLANAYLKCGKKAQAFLAFHEAVKHAFDNWKVWENYTAVAVSAGYLRPTMRGIRRLVELRSKYNDWQVLGSLVHQFVSGGSDAEGQEVAEYQTELGATVAQVKRVTNTHFRVWLAMARYHQHVVEYDQAYDCRRTAYQQAKGVSNWEKNDESSADVHECLAEIYQAVKSREEKREWSGLRMMGRTVLKLLEKAISGGHASEKKHELVQSLKTMLADADAALSATS